MDQRYRLHISPPVSCTCQEMALCAHAIQAPSIPVIISCRYQPKPNSIKYVTRIVNLKYQTQTIYRKAKFKLDYLQSYQCLFTIVMVYVNFGSYRFVGCHVFVLWFVGIVIVNT
jgi:hypothetical protein